MIMDSRRSSLEERIRRNMFSLCRVVEPQALFLAVSFHLHELDEDKLHRELKSTTSKQMIVYHIIMALHWSQNWPPKLVDGLRQAKQTEALRIIGEDSDENLDASEGREACPQISSQGARHDSFSQHPYHLVGNDKCRQTVQDRRDPSLRSGQHRSPNVAQCRTSVTGGSQVGLSSPSLPHSGVPARETSIELKSILKSVILENVFSGHSRQGDSGSKSEDDCELLRQSSAVPASDSTRSAPDTERVHSLTSAADDTSSSKVQQGDRLTLSENLASLEHNTGQQGEDDDVAIARTADHNDDQGISDTDVDSGPSVDPTDSQRVRSNDSEEETEQTQNTDSWPPRGILGNPSPTVSNSFNFHIKKFTIKGQGNGFNIGSTICNNISRANRPPENIQPSDNSHSASPDQTSTNVFDHTLLKRMTNSTNDHTLSQSVQERSLGDAAPQDASFELADTSSVRDAIRANQTGASPNTENSQTLPTDPHVQLMLLKSTDDEDTSPCPWSLSAAESPSGLSDSSSSIVALHESDASSRESDIAHCHLKGPPGPAGQQRMDMTAKERLAPSAAHVGICRQVAGTDARVLEAEGQSASLTVTLPLQDLVEDKTQSSTDTHFLHSCLIERCFHLASAEPGTNHSDNSQARTNHTDNTQSRTNQTDNTQARTNQTYNTQARTNHTDNTQARTNHTDNTQARTNHTYNTQARTNHTDNTQARTNQTDNTQARTNHSDNTQARTNPAQNAEAKTNQTDQTRQAATWSSDESSSHSTKQDKSEQTKLRSTGGSPAETPEVDVIRFRSKEKHHSAEDTQGRKYGMTDKGGSEDEGDGQDRVTVTKSFEDEQHMQLLKTRKLCEGTDITWDTGIDSKPSEAKEITQDKGTDRKPSEAKEITQNKGTDRNHCEAKEITHNQGTDRKPSEAKEITQDNGTDRKPCEPKEFTKEKGPCKDKKNTQFKLKVPKVCEDKEISQHVATDRKTSGEKRNRQDKMADGEIPKDCLTTPADLHASAGGCEVRENEAVQTTSVSKKGTMRTKRHKKLGR